MRTRMTLRPSLFFVLVGLSLTLASRPGRCQDAPPAFDPGSQGLGPGADGVFRPFRLRDDGASPARQAPLSPENKFAPWPGSAPQEPRRLQGAGEAPVPSAPIEATVEPEPPPAPLQLSPEEEPLMTPLRVRASPRDSLAGASSSLRPWKWTTLGAGVLLAGAGAALLAVNGRTGDQCWMPGDLSTCRQVLNTQPVGAALVGAGGVSLIGAVILFSLDARHRRPSLALVGSGQAL